MNNFNWSTTKTYLETTVQWEDKQHWSADQLNWSRQSFFGVVASRWRDSSARGVGPSVDRTGSRIYLNGCQSLVRQSASGGFEKGRGRRSRWMGFAASVYSIIARLADECKAYCEVDQRPSTFFFCKKHFMTLKDYQDVLKINNWSTL